MPTKYNLPDGRFVNVPDNPDRQYLIRLQNTLAQEYPDFIELIQNQLKLLLVEI